MCDPHCIWLFLILILSIPRNFVISNHENHIILLIKKRNFKLTSNLKQNTPRTPTRNPGNRFSFPRSPRNDKLPFPDPPNLRGMKIAGELASLGAGRLPISIDFRHLRFGQLRNN